MLESNQPALALNAGRYLNRLLGRHQPNDPVVETVFRNQQALTRASLKGVELAWNQRGHAPSGVAYAASRYIPVIGTATLAYDIYRMGAYLERNNPGFWRERYNEVMDGYFYWTGHGDFDEYRSSSAEGFRRYDRRKKGIPSQPIYYGGR